MSEVRLRFSGMMRFTASIISVFTGLVFTTLITRNLSAVEYGEWSAIGSLMIYGVFPVLGLGYWYTRYTARDLPIARYGIGVTLGFSLIGIVMFFIAALIFIKEFDAMFLVLLLVSIQVVTTSLVHSLSAISNGKRPEFQAYGIIVFEITKNILALVMIFYVGDFALEHIIGTLIITQIIQIIFLLFLNRKEIKKTVEFSNIKKIIKSIWIPFYSRTSDIVFHSDVLIIALLTSSFVQITIFKIGFS